MNPSNTYIETPPQLPHIKQANHKQLAFVTTLAITALLGVFILWRATPFGLGLVNDSASYVNGAENLLEGNGYTRTSGGGEIKPITHFPPFYSILLASLRFTGLEFVEIAHELNLIFFGMAIFLAGYLAYTLTANRLIAIFTAFLFASSDTFLDVYVVLLSEPLFVVLMLLAVLTFTAYFSRKQLRWLIWTGVILGLAYITRFAALSLMAAFLVALALLTHLRSPLRTSFLRPAGALIGGMLPFILSWSVYNWWITGFVGNRQLIIHIIPTETLFNGLKNLLTWLAPQEILAIHPLFGWTLSGLSLMLPIVLLGMIIWIWKNSSRELTAEHALWAVLSVHILGYLFFLVASISLFDASTPLDDRILLVIYIPELILLVGFLSLLIKRLANPASASNRILFWGRGLMVVFCLVLALLSLRDGLAAVSNLSRDGLGFNHSGWRSSTVIAQLREMPPMILYSNRPTAIYLLTGKSAYVVPTPIDPATTLSRPNFEADLATMRERVQNGQAALVLFSMKTDPETADLYNLITDSLPVFIDLGREQIFATALPTNP